MLPIKTVEPSGALTPIDPARSRGRVESPWAWPSTTSPVVGDPNRSSSGGHVAPGIRRLSHVGALVYPPAMNVERLHFVTEAIIEEIDALGMMESLDSLTSSLQQMANNPADPALQQILSSARTQLQERLAQAPINTWPPSDRQILTCV